MPSPTAQATLLGLPSDLLVRVLACLATKERARLPLVCKALHRLANDPATLLWESVELTVTPENRRQAVQATTRSLLQARGRHTKTLCIKVSDDLPEPLWRVFGALLPPLFPALQTLAVTPSIVLKRVDYELDTQTIRTLELGYGFRAPDIDFIVGGCGRLQSLTIPLKAEFLSEALVSMRGLPGLTSLQLEVFAPQGSTPELQAALQPLSALGKMKRLVLCLPKAADNFVLAHCILSQLAGLSHLAVTGCRVSLPASVSRLLHHLTTLVLHANSAWEDFWGGVSGLKSLKQLSMRFPGVDLPPPLQSPGFSTSLTVLSCIGRGPEPLRQGPPTGGLLALPALRTLHLQHTGLALRLDWASLTSLRALEYSHRDAMGPRPVFMQPSLLNRLTSLHSHHAVTDEMLKELSSAERLCSLTLGGSLVSKLPEGLASARNLTKLVLDTNYNLAFDAAAFDVLNRMPALLCLRVCVCGVVGDAPPAVWPQSLAYLQAISGGLAACEACFCHAEDWEPQSLSDFSDEEGSDADV